MSGRDIHNIIELIKKDAKAAFSNPIVTLILIAIIILPSLYAIINIEACWDPYEKTGDMDFAIANLDNGSVYEGYGINVGNDMVDSLKNQSKFHWVFVSEHDLREGVKNGTYYAGIIIPQNLSENIVSITTDHPQTAKLIYVVNDKLNPVAPRIANQGANTIYREMNAKIVEFINLAAYGKLGELQEGLASGASQMSSGAAQLSSGAAQVSSGASQVSGGVGQVEDGASQLKAGANQVSDGAGQVSAGLDQVDQNIANVEKKYNVTPEEINSGINKLPDGKVKDALLKVTDGANKTYMLVNGSNTLAKGSIKLAGNSSLLADGSVTLAEGALSLAAGAQLLSNAAAYALIVAASSLSGAANSLAGVTGINETLLGEYFYSPISLETVELFHASNFGSQAAPFYIVLSMWVGALITCMMIKPGVSTKTKYSPLEMYFGKLVIFIVMAILQSSVTAIIAITIGIDIDNMAMFILTSWFVSVVFMIIIYSLVSALGNVGEGVGVLLLVFQISGTGGMYPIQIMGSTFKALHPFLPMTYGINVMREVLLGLLWENYIPSFFVLLAIAIITIIVCVLIKEKADDITHYFEKKLEESGLF